MAEPPLHAHSSGVSAVIERNINALLAHRAAEERKRGLQEKIAEVVTRFAGSMLFVYLHLILFGGWILASGLGTATTACRFIARRASHVRGTCMSRRRICAFHWHPQ
jgi:hypothetical protein